MIKLDVVVTDASGTPVPGIPFRDFTVLDMASRGAFSPSRRLMEFQPNPIHLLKSCWLSIRFRCQVIGFDMNVIQ